MKVATRNNLLKKLANSKWGTNARTIRTTALALCYSTVVYAAPVWARSSHANKLNPVLNQACRSITGCLKPTNVEDLYLIAGIAPPDIRREVCGRVERTKQTKDERLFVWPHQAWDWVLPIKTEICLSSGAAVSLLGGFGGMLPQEIFFNRYSLLQSGSIKIHMYCTKKKKKLTFLRKITI